jgi:hypothetical protein
MEPGIEETWDRLIRSSVGLDNFGHIFRFHLTVPGGFEHRMLGIIGQNLDIGTDVALALTAASGDSDPGWQIDRLECRQYGCRSIAEAVVVLTNGNFVSHVCGPRSLC